jgi:hypothetical protein
LPNASATVMVAFTTVLPLASTVDVDSTSVIWLGGPATWVSTALPLAVPSTALIVCVPATVDDVSVAV